MSSRSIIPPRTLKGFRDYLPSTMLARERLIEVARGVYRSFGFAPIDTPALEYAEVLLGKGGEESDKQLFRFLDHGQRDVALRFDLTVPLARFAAQHIGELGTPFKRYHMASVWRGENTQRGRYREFMQCDFDTIGTENVIADIETALVIHELLVALGIEKFTIHLTDRRLLSGVLTRLGIDDRSTPILRALDKLTKVGPERVAEEMVTSANITQSQAAEVLKLAALSGSNTEILKELDPLVEGTPLGQLGLLRLKEMLEGLDAAGVPESRLQLDVSIARGLDYYTGTVFETLLDDLPSIGSICSGGRYDDLASLYTKERLPGIGASLGLDRLLAALQELNLLESRSTPAQVLVPFFSKDHRADYLRLAMELRRAGVSVEVYPEPKKLGAQLKYADRRGHALAVVIGDSEWQEQTCQLKVLGTGKSETLPQSELLAAIELALKLT